MTLRDKRLGVGTERRYGFTAALSGCAPLSNVPVSSLGTPTPLVRSLKGLHSRRSVSRQTASIEGHAASWESPETRQRWAHGRAVGRKSVEVDATATGIFKRTYFNAGRARFAQAPSIGPQSQTKSG